ncbi:hypothetical protein OAT16_08805 [Prolixibacteraceae bacterium]|nr:hypothetical protein [Prolixibacteraceae bacterium]
MFLQVILASTSILAIIFTIALTKGYIVILGVISMILIYIFLYLCLEKNASSSKSFLQVNDLGFCFKGKSELWYWQDVKWFKIKEHRKTLRMIISIKMKDGTRFDFPQNYPFDSSEDIDEYLHFYDDMKIFLPRCTQKSNVYYENKGATKIRRTFSILTVLILTYKNIYTEEFMVQTIMILIGLDVLLPRSLEIYRKRISAKS